jgi:hypothetical protein
MINDPAVGGLIMPLEALWTPKIRLSPEEATEAYILLRLRFEEIKRMGFLVQGLHRRAVSLPSGALFTHDELRDAIRTAFFGWFATLTDKDGRAVYAFSPLLTLFRHRESQIVAVQKQCEKCHVVLHRFRGNVAFHNRRDVRAQIDARKALLSNFPDVDAAMKNFGQLMTDLIAEELQFVPHLPAKLAEFDLAHHSAFKNVPEATSLYCGPAFYSCEVLNPESDDSDSW